MKKTLLILCFFLLSKIVPAQSSATAVATATIVHSVGAEELVQDGLSNTASIAAEPVYSIQQGAYYSPIQQVDFTTFRIAGNSFVYSLSVEPNLPHPVMQKLGRTNQLSGITIKPSPTKPDAFVLGSLVDIHRIHNGEYDGQTMLDVTIHFN